MKRKTRRLLLMLSLSLLMTVAYAQQRQISGTVRDNTGAPVAGATYVVKGTNTAGSTDENGAFTVTVNNANPILVFSSVGFGTLEVPVGQSNTLSVVMQQTGGNMSEVVVTALGIRRERKSLGYAVQEIKGESIVESREPNLANALTGKVAGLQVVRSSNGPAGSSKLVLRGYNSLTGSNEPLIVVDGLPVSNFTGATNNDYWNPSLDMGNGIADINPEDIESISVLKGPSAAALYGSRAGNGVIMITTKSGRKQKGLGLTLSSSLGFESIFTSPELQNSFGQGTNGTYNETEAWSWGPKITGQQVKNWNGQMVPLTAYDNLNNYFDKKGTTQNHSLSFQQQIQSTSVYTSFNRLEDKSMLPGVKLTRTNLMARAITKFGNNDRWTSDTKVQYTDATANNRPMGGPNPTNGYYMMNMLPRSIDVRDFSAGVNDLGNMVWWSGAGNQVNPYWSINNNLNRDTRSRFIMNASLKYQFADWLNAEIKGGGDMYTTEFDAKTFSGSPLTATGRYSLGKQTFRETNYGAHLTANKDQLFGKFGAMATVGGNLMHQKFSGLGTNVGDLVVPNLFYIRNGVGNPVLDENFNQKKINSVFGSVQVNYNEYLYVDATFRNDWSSALHESNRSFFYPSLSLSYVFTDMLETMGSNLPSWFSYGKLRASYATVGNDLNPYLLYNVYQIGQDPNRNPTASRDGVLLNPFIKSELIKSLELGGELRFLNNRLNLDVSWYRSNATNQIIDLPMDPLSGYRARKINAGNIQNSGVELVANARILTNPRSLVWNMMLNYSNNRNKIIELAEDVKEYPLGGYDDIAVRAVVGGLYGDIYGTKYKRVNEAGNPNNGQLLLNGNGLPERDPQIVYLGNQQPKAMFGFNNTFGYKGLQLGFQVDARLGGKMFSGTLADMQERGTSALTVVNGARDSMVVEGMVWNATASKYETNTRRVSPQQYWTAVAGANNLGITEANLYDATNIRLRHVQLSYDVPATLVSRTPLQRAKIGVSMNNVWMIKSYMQGLDPESVFATGTNAVGFENGSAPTVRTFLINLVLGF